MRQRLALFALFLALTALQGCATTAYGIYDDKRLVDTITSDKTLASKIKADIAKESLSAGWSVAVFCYYSNVYVVGEVPHGMQNKVLTIARRHSPRSVTPHWFTKASSDTNNIVLATKLRTELIGTKGLSSTRIDTEVNAGRVILLGVVKDDAEKRLAIRAAGAVKGVTSVTSYLILPQRAGQDPNNGPIEETVHTGTAEPKAASGETPVEAREI